jgi:acyl-CoA thioesterase-1
LHILTTGRELASHAGRLVSAGRTGGEPMRAFAALLILVALGTSSSAATVHIVAFGDSATAGYLVPRKDAYPAQLQVALRKKGYDAVVANEGINGDTTAGALKRFDAAIAPGTDIAIVELGTNDLRLHVPAKRMRANLTEILRTLRARGVAVLVIGLGRLDLSDTARAAGVPYVQWVLPPGKYRARDGQHFNAQGYAIVVAKMLPKVEALIASLSR